MHALRNLLLSNEFREIDYQFANYMGKCHPQTSHQLLLLFALLSNALAKKQTCLDVDQTVNTSSLFSEARIEELLAEIQSHSCVGEPGSEKPVIFSNNKLFLKRYYDYELRIATDLMQRNRPLKLHDNSMLTSDMLNQHCGQMDDYQKIAAAISLTRQFCLITGGPGSGKTRTIGGIVRLLAETLPGNAMVRLAAPTGKAAKRMNDVLQTEFASLDTSSFPINYKVSTIHRLLGMRPDGKNSSYSFTHNKNNPLHADVLILDEISMIDIFLMTHLLEALPASARLILVGDKDQLSSIEAGNLLADISTDSVYDHETTSLIKDLTGVSITPSPLTHGLDNACCHLANSFRFDSAKGIGRLAQAIVNMNFETIEAINQHDPENPINFLDPQTLRSAQGIEELVNFYQTYFTQSRVKIDPLALLETFESFRILSIMREGEFGVETLNKRIEESLNRQDILETKEAFYHGRPVLITRNDYKLDLFNGDTGICYFDENEGIHKVIFKDADGSARHFLANRLPPHETCFVMTVHKAQGSEFNHVILVLGGGNSEQIRDLFNRQTLYTGVTRSRNTLAIYSDAATFKQAIERPLQRSTGLSSHFVGCPPG